MRIVFYSTNSNHYSEGSLTFDQYPSCAVQWKNLKKKYPEHEFIVVVQKPGMFLRDGKKRTKNSCKDSVCFVFVDEDNADPEKFAGVIATQKPNVAIAVTYWTQPFDWMSLKDSLVGERLSSLGIRAVCHSAETSSICFDKWKTHQFLEENGFSCAKAVYVHHEMFWAERNKNAVAENVYREFVFEGIKKLKFPVVIKDIFGLSSFGMDVVKTFEQAKTVLLSRKNNGDRLVEEFLDGDSYGLEIYGSRERGFTVTPPLINSVNQFGLTSPKQNVKLGPVEIGNDELYSEMLRLAKLLDFNGIVQVDLLKTEDGKWYVIEINSRISGMTQTMAFSMGLGLYELILMSAGIAGSRWNGKYSFIMNLKFPLLEEKTAKSLFQKDFVRAVNVIENHEAKQLREVGYTEVIFGGTETLEKLMEQLEVLNAEFNQVMEPVFYGNAKLLAEKITRT